jgi:steroid delta-isomerase-like uncharacterized protein
MSTIETNKTLVRRFYEEVFNKVDEKVAHEILSDTFKVHALAPLKPIIGIPAFLERVRLFHTVFPDVVYHMEDQIAEGDKVTTRFTAKGTHTNTFLDVPATYKKVGWVGIAIHRIEGGKLSENWVVADFLALKNQLL